MWNAEKERQQKNQVLSGTMVNVVLPDGLKFQMDSTKTFESLVPAASDAANPVVGIMLRKGSIESLVELHRTIGEVANHVEIARWIHFNDPVGKQMFWHSSAHLLGAAIELHHTAQWRKEGLTRIDAGTGAVTKETLEGRIIPLLDDGPALNDPPGGFYYDFYIQPAHLGEDSFPKLEKTVNKLVSQNVAFERLEVSRDFALDFFSYNPFKVALINRIPASEKVTLYRCGDFVDLCKGPHLPRSSLVGAFEVQRASGAYWAGNSANPYLQRLYGLSFPTKPQLEEWKRLREEAERRDHRLIGRAQSLFMFHDYSPGSPFFLPHGTKIFNKLVQTVRSEYVTRGYDEVITPLLFDKKLWQTSGHWDHYRENMFLIQGGDEEPHKIATPPASTSTSSSQAKCSHGEHPDHCHGEADGSDGLSSGLKPMNCPGHCLTFKAEAKSYRDLPVRYSDFSSLHRNEAKGTLSGLTRVRRFHQDDAHIFCTPEQIESELRGVLDMVEHLYGHVFGFPYDILVSTRPESSMGTDEEWHNAETALMSAVKAVGRTFTINPGDGAFYGPKIDFIVTDALHRKHQCATIQLDFQLPQRFGLTYMAADGSKKTPVIIHRAVMGSIERMFAMLTEHYAGKWPLWLSPRQLALCTVSEKHVDYANKLLQELKLSYNTELFADDQKLPNKVRLAQAAQFNFILVVGNAEMETQSVSVRARDGTQLGTMTLPQLRTHLNDLIQNWK